MSDDKYTLIIGSVPAETVRRMNIIAASMDMSLITWLKWIIELSVLACNDANAASKHN